MTQQQDLPTDAMEQAQQLMARVREDLEHKEFDSALATFMELHPADQSELLAELDDEDQQRFLRALSPEESARILEQMVPEEAAEVFGEIETPALADILDEAPPDVAADLLKQLPEEQSQEALEGMEEARDVTPLLEYPDESAGGIMTPEYVSVRDDATAAIALDLVRIHGSRIEEMGAVPVVDTDRKLVGSLSVLRLALARPSTLVRDIMDPEVVSVAVGTDQEECALLMGRYDLKYLPVVDEERRLAGIILIEDVVDVLEEEATEDMYKMAGITGERLFGPFQSSVRRRLPWLFLNLATTILAALTISLFESTIVKVVALAVFLPVVAGQGGIGGTQTLTMVIRGMALRDVPERRAFQLLAREVSLGVIHGLVLGLAIGVLAYAWKGNATLGLVLGAAMVGNMVIGGFAGAATPLLLRLFRVDPALGSAVIVTTITDVVGFLLFLGIAAAVVDHLV